ncbi:MAG: tyrosine-type recombinase/integrase, partial [Thermoanaerobaculia bacterium]
ESSGSTKKGDAERLLKLREGDVARGLPVSAKIGRLRFEQAVSDVVADYRQNGRASTSDVEARIRLHIEPWFGGRRMASITTADVRAYSGHRLGEGAAPASINRELAVLKRAFRLAEQGGTVLSRPHIAMLKEDNTRQGFFERDEFEDVRANLPEYLRGAVTLMYFAGWRRGEVLPLAWAQVDRSARTIRLEPGTTKNAEGRTLPYGQLPELVDVVDTAWRHHQELARGGTISPCVFTRDGERIGSFKKAWASACKAAGVPDRLLHDFRRTAVRNLVRAGVPDAIAMRITGHKTRSVFDRYNIVSEADIREGLGALAGKEKGKSGRKGRVAMFASH